MLGALPPPVGQPGDSSLLPLRWVRSGAAHTTVLGASLAPGTPYDPARGAPIPLASLYRLAGLADLNGDGRLEIVTFSSYYEGYGVTVSEWTLRRDADAAGDGVRGVSLRAFFPHPAR